MLVASILAGFLWRTGSLRQIWAIRWWAVAFGSVALAAGLGGTCHGFVYWMPGTTLFQLWTGMLYAVSFASLTMLVGTIGASSFPPTQGWLMVGAGLKAIVVWAILLQSPHFRVVVLDYGLSLGIVLALQVLWICRKAGASQSLQPAGWIGAGVLVSGLAMAVLGSQISIAAVLHPNDLYHLVQMVGLGLLYQGAKQLQDQR